MSTLGDRRRAYIKEQAKQKKKESKKETKELKSEAEKLVKELSPEHFLNVKEIEERLIREGHYTVPEEYFHIRDTAWLQRAHELGKEYKALRGMLTEEKANILTTDVGLEPKYLLAKDEYVADEVARYLGKRDIGLIASGWKNEFFYKLLIVE